MSDPESKAISYIQSGCQKAQEGHDEVLLFFFMSMKNAM
jgi:hypothetical protein